MTEGQYNTFVRSLLRRGSMRWRPIYETLVGARVSRGVYLCNGCLQHVPASINVNGKRLKNAIVDHILPVVDPEAGRVDWAEFIHRLFCERDNLQVLCLDCHMKKTTLEKNIAVERRNKEKDYNEQL